LYCGTVYVQILEFEICEEADKGRQENTHDHILDVQDFVSQQFGIGLYYVSFVPGWCQNGRLSGDIYGYGHQFPLCIFEFYDPNQEAAEGEIAL
jgi:hypothetical protein